MIFLDGALGNPPLARESQPAEVRPIGRTLKKLVKGAPGFGYNTAGNVKIVKLHMYYTALRPGKGSLLRKCIARGRSVSKNTRPVSLTNTQATRLLLL